MLQITLADKKNIVKLW